MRVALLFALIGGSHASRGGSLRDGAHKARALLLGGAIGLRDVFANARLGRAHSPPQFEAGDAVWRLAARSRRALATGVSAGVGLALAGLLAERGVHVLLGCRSPERGRAAAARVRKRARRSALVHLLALDTRSLASVRACARAAARHGRLDLLVANAGVMATPWARVAESAGGGLEEQWAANFAGHFLLVRLLWPALAADARVLLLSSVAHHSGFRPAELARLAADCAPRPAPGGARRRQPSSPYAAYKRSTWALSCAAPELQVRLCTGLQTVCSVHPGLVDTRLALGFFRRGPPRLRRDGAAAALPGQR